MSEEKPFIGFSTFLKTPICDYTRKIGVLGIPHDGSASFRPGTRFGPGAVREASKMLTDGEHPLFETLAAEIMTDLGDVDVSNSNVSRSVSQIADHVSRNFFLKDGKPIFSIGGDHTVTLGIIRAMADRYKNLKILHIDAHCDTWETNFGDPIGHGTVIRDIVKTGLVKAENILSVGMRSPVDPKTKRWLESQGGQSFSMYSFQNHRQTIMAAVADHLREGSLYVTLDIDAFDPAYAPGTGTPEVNGMTPREVMDILNLLGPHTDRLVGMDVVEVSPAYDNSQITALLAATMLYHVASFPGFHK